MNPERALLGAPYQLVGVFDRIAHRWYEDALKHMEGRQALDKIVVGF